MRNIIMGIIEPSLSLMMSYVCNCRSFACQYPEREREREREMKYLYRIAEPSTRKGARLSELTYRRAHT